MGDTAPSAEDLVRRLPLPLAQLYRRALNARAPLERHQSAYFLWEAAVKLLGSVAVATYAEGGPHDPKLTERLGNLARPALGHWWEFAYLLVPALADQGRHDFAAVKDVLLGRVAGPREQAGALDAALRQELGDDKGRRGPVRLRDLFDRLVSYRNREIGHGAVGRRAPPHYEHMADLLLAGLTEVLGELDVLAGGRLVYVARVWRHRAGDWLVARDDLTGEAVRRIATVNRPPAEAAGLPHSDCLCLERTAGASEQLLSLRPLVVFDGEGGEVLFLNSQRGPRRTEYLGYTSGRVVIRDEASGERRALLARALGVAAEAEGSTATAPDDTPAAAAPPAEPAPAPAPEAGGGRRVTFTVTAGPRQGQAFAFTRHDTLLVGRSRRAHLQLPAEDEYVSRLHFLVEINPPECRLTDLGTKNGTTVNGRKVTGADLRSGDVIGVGKTSLRVAVEGQGPAPGPYTPPPVPPLPKAVPAVRAPRGGSAGGCPVCGAAVPAGSAGLPLPFLCPACRAQASGRAQPIPGYALLRELGGDLGGVYLAARAADGQPVALRLLPLPAAAARPQVKCFLRDVSRLAQLDHPHIIAWRDFGEASGHLYFVQDHVRGTDLTGLLQAGGGRLPPARAAGLLSQVLEALAYAHARQLVHSTLRPGNVLVTGKGEVRLADFGLAWAYQASPLSGVTLRGKLGSAATFLAPEQLTRPGEAGPPADQYAAGALLYHLLTGCLPHDLPGTLPRQLLMLLQEEPVPVEARRPDLPRPLAEVVHRALLRDPPARFPDVEAMRRALVPFARGSRSSG
jgi:serine/threonine-protein kinase